MKIALIGYGKIGHLVEAVALSKEHEIILTITSENEEVLSNKEAFREVDVCIDFSRPECVVEHIRKVVSYGKPMVVGTTGWYHRLDEVKALVLQSGVGFLYAPNFSVGMLLFMKMISYAAELMNHFPEYDVGGVENHHREKKDTPSGTAQALAQILIDRLERKNSVIYDLMNREIAPSELQFASVRCGYDPGTHEVIFDSSSDTISLLHRNRNRLSFAQGALSAAEWVRRRSGFFSLEDMINAMPLGRPDSA